MNRHRTAAFKKLYPKIHKHYSKELMDCHKASFESGYDPMDYFVTYLLYMRDRYILTVPDNRESFEKTFESEELNALDQAIDEYDKYIACAAWILGYEELMSEADKAEAQATEELLEAYTIAKQLHWQAFWATVEKYMEKWSVMNDFEIQKDKTA